MRGPRLSPSDEGDTPRYSCCRSVFTRAASELHLVVDFVFVREVVDQAGADRVLGQVGAVIDQLAHFGVRLVPALRDPAYQLLVEVAVERLRHLAMRRRERALGEGVRRGLVVADVDGVGQRPILSSEPRRKTS